MTSVSDKAREAQIVVSQKAQALRDYLSIRGLNDGEIERTLIRFEAETLERAAKVADELDMGPAWSTADTCSRFHARNAIATAIRQLKGSGDE